MLISVMCIKQMAYNYSRPVGPLEGSYSEHSRYFVVGVVIYLLECVGISVFNSDYAVGLLNKIPVHLPDLLLLQYFTSKEISYMSQNAFLQAPGRRHQPFAFNENCVCGH